MKKQVTKNLIGFQINMQIIVDAFEEQGTPILYHKSNPSLRFSDIRLFHNHENLTPTYVYLVRGKDLINTSFYTCDTAILSIGSPPSSYYYGNCSVLELSIENDLLQILEFVQNVFETNHRWDMALQNALNQDLGIKELCRIGLNYFKNPLFVRDYHLYILACPKKAEEFSAWERDESTGFPLIPLDTMNEFKVDKEYLKSLDTRGARILESESRSYRDLYVNIWDQEGNFQARLLIAELETPLKPGQFPAAEYFAYMIQLALERENLKSGTSSRPFEMVLKDILDGKLTDEVSVSSHLALNHWKLLDMYICIKIGINQRDWNVMNIVSTRHFIEAKISGSYTLIYEQNMLIIVNLSLNGSLLSDCLKQLSYLIRESLYKAGISNIYHNFLTTPAYYKQASIALHYGIKIQSMLWIYQFEDFALEYLTDIALDQKTPDLICSSKLQLLKQYDKENKTEFYRTLHLYLKNDRNAVQTAKELYLHRSTLFYRLNRIRDIITINLDDPKERLYLNLSFYIWDKEETKYRYPKGGNNLWEKNYMRKD